MVWWWGWACLECIFEEEDDGVGGGMVEGGMGGCFGGIVVWRALWLVVC